ncbi:hypothetical protein [Pararhodobacter sp.]|uniref:hypothetical protein n=1 Tax=Pararhodobacter sp. TaxID=2127056 RepID=UPI002FDE680D
METPEGFFGSFLLSIVGCPRGHHIQALRAREQSLFKECVVVLDRRTHATLQSHRPDTGQATLIFLRLGPSGISPDRIVNMRGRYGKRRQQARKQGNQETEAGKAQGLGNGQFRRGETCFAWREEGQISLPAGAYSAALRDRLKQTETPEMLIGSFCWSSARPD